MINTVLCRINESEINCCLSHDELFFNGFEANPEIKEATRFDYVFKHILPRLKEELADEIIKKNPIRMLKCMEV